MEPVVIFLISAFILIMGFVMAFSCANRKKVLDHRSLLEPIVKSQGFKYISGTAPKTFENCPFTNPGFEIRFGPCSDVNGQRGEWDETVVVTIEDGEGVRHRVWAKEEFEVFELARVRWGSEKEELLPASLRMMMKESNE